jgi:hypothetical protein
MVRMESVAGRRVWVTARDERVCEWLRIVRVTDVQAIRWLLGVLNESDRPVSTRRAQEWVARMELVGLVERENLGGPGGSVVWGTFEATGQSRPNVDRQTTRHEVAVSAVSARYLAAGFRMATRRPTHLRRWPPGGRCRHRAAINRTDRGRADGEAGTAVRVDLLGVPTPAGGRRRGSGRLSLHR